MMNLIHKITRAAKRLARSFKASVLPALTALMSGRVLRSAKAALADCRGESYVDTGIKILICVVLGALLLAGLYSLFGDTVLPTIATRIKEMFNYAG